MRRAEGLAASGLPRWPLRIASATLRPHDTDPKRSSPIEGRTAVMPHEFKPSQALHLWRDVHLSLVREGEPDLSARQIAILLTIYLDLPPHTVRGLAQRLKVTKPVITRALDSMGKIGLVDRKRDETDKRNVIIQRTVKGALAVEALADRIVARMREETT